MGVNLEEINRFSAMANKWWDPNGHAMPLHHINPARLEYIQRHLTDRDANVLDLGCGAGILTESLFKIFPNTHGVDACQDMIDVATQHASQQGLDITYTCSSIEEMSISNNLDAIICMELLEHIDNPVEFLSLCYSALKPGGKIFLSTINRSLKSYLGAIIGAENILQLLPKGTHTYSKFIKPSELNRMLIANDFEVIDISGMKYNPISKTASLSNSIDINYLAHAVRR